MWVIHSLNDASLSLFIHTYVVLALPNDACTYWAYPNEVQTWLRVLTPVYIYNVSRSVEGKYCYGNKIVRNALYTRKSPR